MINMIQNFNFVEEVEFLTAEEWQHLKTDNAHKETVQRVNKEEESESADTSSSESCGEPHRKRPHVGDFVPFDVKVKAVTLAQLHPAWSVKTVRSKSTRLLTSKGRTAVGPMS